MLSSRLILVLAVAACGGTQSSPPTVQNEVAAPPPAPPPKSEIEVAKEKMRSFADGMCACKDKVCADKVQDELTVWAQQMAKDAGDKPDPKPSEADLKEMTETGARYAECMTAAMTSP